MRRTGFPGYDGAARRNTDGRLSGRAVASYQNLTAEEWNAVVLEYSGVATADHARRRLLWKSKTCFPTCGVTA